MLRFYFDFISPYAYLAWSQVRELAAERDLQLVPQPVLFAGLLGHWGQLGPAEIPPKRVYIFKDCVRCAAKQGVPFNMPPHHPFNPLPPLRVCMPEVAGERTLEAIDVIYRAVWGEGRDIGDVAVLEQVLTGAGLPGSDWVARTRDPSVKLALREATEQAVSQGVFGVPTMVINGELFWGNDRVSHVRWHLDGEDPVDVAQSQAIQARFEHIDSPWQRPQATKKRREE